MLKGILSIIGLFTVLFLSVYIIGCGDSVNPLSPKSSDVTTVGELKESDVNTKTKGIEIVGYEVAEVVPGAPSLLIEDEEEEESIMALSHVDEPGGSEDFRIVMKGGYHIPKGCDIEFIVDGEDIGSVTAPKNFTEVTARVSADDLPAGEVTITVEIVCDGTTAASAEITIDRPSDSRSSSLLLISNDDEDEDEENEDDEDEDEEQKTLRADDAYLGDSTRHVVVEFEDDINASSRVKENVTILSNDTDLDYRIVSYGENGFKVTFITRKDLPAGEYTISYNGKGGLKGRPNGEPVEEFEFTFTVEEEELTIREAIATRTSVIIPKGLYRAGSTFLTGLIHFGYKVSKWTKQSLESPAFHTEKEEGETEVWFVTRDEIGLKAGDTALDLLILVAVSTKYNMVPAETAAQMRLLYPDQPDGQVVVVASSPIYNPTTGKSYLQMLGREDSVALGLWLTSLEVNASLDGYTLFAVGKKGR